MINRKNILLCLSGSCILAFGIYQIHSHASITEGGALGLTLLLQHWFDLSPGVTSLIINLICYFIGIRTLGKEFLINSLVSAIGFSAFYLFCEQFPLLWPNITSIPVISAPLGGCFVGIGVGLCVLAGGAPTGDDALAMSISKLFKWPIQRVYLITDLTVLLLSLTYIPARRIIWSVLTVVISGQIIGLLQKWNKDKNRLP